MKKINLKLSIFIIFQFFVSTIFSQSFYDGFKDGYKNGFCEGKVGCVSPAPPPAPPPAAGESYDSYQDGYNRGFKMGVDKSAQNANQENSTQTNTTQGYKTTNSNGTIDYMYKSTDLENKMASNARQNFEVGMKRAQELFDEGQYNDCINCCNLISGITHLVSFQYYNIISMSYYKLGNENKGKKYAKEAEEFLKKN